MVILIPTIPHTGTKLLADSLLFEFEHNALINKPKNGQKIDDHIYPEKITRWKELMQEYPAIVPLRHPIKCAVSWERRNRDLGEMVVMWYILVEQLDQFNPHYLPIDSPKRNQYLNRINQSLGLKLSTDWPITNSKHGSSEATIQDLGLNSRGQILRLCKNIEHFLDRFY